MEPGKTLTHYADRADHAGHGGALAARTASPTPPNRTPWTVPEQNQGMTSAPQLLAETLARWIAHTVGGGVMIESKGRPLAPGDVMVLVRRGTTSAAPWCVR